MYNQISNNAAIFLSTPSARRATRALRDAGGTPQISIHALCEEGDALAAHAVAVRLIFLSTPSARRATRKLHPEPGRRGISIHALCEEGDAEQLDAEYQAAKFLSTPSARRATLLKELADAIDLISIHALCEEGDQGALGAFRAPRRYFYPRPLRGGRQQKQRQNLYFQTNYTTFCTNLEEL